MRRLSAEELCAIYRMVAPEAYTYEHLSRKGKIKYEQWAQAIEVHLGLIPASQVEYFLCHEDEVTQASDIVAILSLLDTHVEAGDFFDIYLLRAGSQVGLGRYQLTEERAVHEMSCTGEAQGLFA